MRLTDLFSMALRNMLKRKMRTILTVLGVVIGATSITVMISLGVAVNINFEEQIEAMGPRALRINIHQNWQPEPGQITDLNMDVVNRINAMENVRVATPIVDMWSLTVMSGNYIANWVDVVGILPEAMEPLGMHIEQGYGFDLDSDELQMIFGANVQSRFLNPRNQNVRDPWMMGMMGVENTVDLLGQPLRMSYRPEFGQPSPPGGAPTGGTAAVRPYIVEGRGILASSDDWMASNSIFMPLDQLLQIQADEQEWRDRENMGGGGGGMIFMGDGGMMIANDPEGFRQIIALVDHPNNIQTVVDDLIAMGINENSMWFEAQLVLSQMESTRTLQNLLLATGIVSLVVAAIGIANTMIMSIYERTKEIGVMKVIGASVKDVRRLFLLEAAFIGAIGGLVGLAASAGVSYALNNAGNIDLFGGGLPPWMQMDTAGSIVSFIPQWLYLLALIFSVAVGLISGFLPARRATRISALAAIKTE